MASHPFFMLNADHGDEDGLGNSIGASFDARNKRLAELKKKSGVDIQRTIYPTISKKDQASFEAQLKNMDDKSKQKAYRNKAIYKIVIPSQFASGSAQLSPGMKSFFTDVAKAYKSDGVRKVMIVGHADSRGDAQMNQRLSERRAKAVARAFMGAGYPAAGIYFQGAGETEPVADNATVDGRAKNRRVEIIDAGNTHDLALAKRFSITESKAAMKKTQSTEKVNPTIHTAVARNLSGTDSILPFHGVPYHGQQLLTSGHKAAKIAKKSTGFLDSVMASIEKAQESVVGTAYASGEQRIPAFLDDDLAIAGAIKRLDGKGKPLFKPSDYLQGYYYQPVYAYLDGNAFLSLQPISILKEESLADASSRMMVYKRYDGKGDKPDARLTGSARLYVSGNKMLYRWKASHSSVKRGGILGLDILLPEFGKGAFHKTHTKYLSAQIYYMKNSKVYVHPITLNIKLKKESKINWGV